MMKALVVGDIILDRYIRGRVQRISPEAPIPVVEVENRSVQLGGAANVARNLASIGAKVTLAGRVGKDREGETLMRLLESNQIDHSGIVESEQPTTTKSRVTAGQQQLVRFDVESREPLDQREESGLRSFLRDSATRFDVLILQDYGKGVLTPALISEARNLSKGGLLSFADPNGSSSANWEGFHAIKPNWEEACRAAENWTNHTIPAPGSDAIELVCDRLMQKWHPDHLLITLGARGMSYCDRSRKRTAIHGQSLEVFDVSGAGDTALAVFAHALSSGLCGVSSAKLANAAAAYVVGKLGTAVVPASAYQAIWERILDKDEIQQLSPTRASGA